MRRRWGIRITALIFSFALAIALMVLAGMDPRPLPLALVTVAGALTYWMSADIAARVQPARWVVHRTDDVARGGDSRLEHLRWRLAARPKSAVEVDTFAPLLIDLIDDHVAAVHGIDRARDPAAFDRVVGPELAAFVARPPTDSQARSTQFVEGIVTRIESL
jgi:hypothetical protein